MIDASSLAMPSEGKDEGGEVEGTPLFRASVLLTDDLHDVADRVREQFAKAFDGVREEKSTEFTLDQTLAFEEYVQRCEQLLDSFLEKEQVSRQEFFQECRESLEGRYAALFAEDANAWFVYMLLAIEDFEEFYKIMTGARYASLHQTPCARHTKK